MYSNENLKPCRTFYPFKQYPKPFLGTLSTEPLSRSPKRDRRSWGRRQTWLRRRSSPPPSPSRQGPRFSFSQGLLNRILLMGPFNVGFARLSATQQTLLSMGKTQIWIFRLAMYAASCRGHGCRGVMRGCRLAWGFPIGLSWGLQQTKGRMYSGFGFRPWK